MRMNLLFIATTSDIISDYCFGESYNNLVKEDLNESYVLADHESRLMFHFATFSSWLGPTIKALPPRLMVSIMPAITMFIKLGKVKSVISL
jgi:hypothetical protein